MQAARRRSWRPSSGTRRTTTNKLPDSDGLLAAHGPGRDRRVVPPARSVGNHELRAGAATRHRDRRGGLRARRGPRAGDGVARDGQVPDEREALSARRPPYEAGDLFKNPDAGRLLRKLVEAEKGAAARGPARPAARRARSLLQRRYRPGHGRVLRTAGRAVPLRGLRRLHGESRDAGLHDYRGYEIYKNPSANQGPAELFALNILEGFDLPQDGAQQRRLHSHLGGSRQARDGRPRKVSSATPTSSRFRTRGC